MNIKDLKRVHDSFSRPLVLEIQENGSLTLDEFKKSGFLGGNTTRAFRYTASDIKEPKTIAGEVIANLSGDRSVQKLKAALHEPNIRKRLEIKKSIAASELGWLKSGRDQRDDTFRRVKVVDLALKEFVFCLEGGIERFVNTDAALDKHTLKPLAGLTFDGARIRKNPSMGDIKSAGQYIAIQNEIRSSFENGWVYDFVAWNFVGLLKRNHF